MSDENFNWSKIALPAIVSIILTAMGIWMASLQTTVNDVIALKPQISRIQLDVAANYQWQKDWQTNGQLPADVEQNKDIEFLKKRMEAVDNLNLEARLTAMEVKLEGNGVLLLGIHKQVVKDKE